MKIMLNIKQEDYAFGSTVDAFLMDTIPSLSEVIQYDYSRIQEFFDECLSKHKAEPIMLQEHKINRFGDNDEMRYSYELKGRKLDILSLSYNSVSKHPKVDISEIVEFAVINLSDELTCVKVKENGDTIIKMRCENDQNNQYIPPFVISLREKEIFIPEKHGLEVTPCKGYKRFNMQ